MIHANSHTAYHATRSRRNTRAHSILTAFIFADAPMTDREVKNLLKLTDMNAVRPRVTELCEIGALQEVGQQKCPVSGRTVRVCAPTASAIRRLTTI